MLEWPEYQLHGNDLEVTFIKIQYRETSGSRTWNTLDEDLAPTTSSYVVSGLKPGNCSLLHFMVGLLTSLHGSCQFLISMTFFSFLGF